LVSGQQSGANINKKSNVVTLMAKKPYIYFYIDVMMLVLIVSCRHFIASQLTAILSVCLINNLLFKKFVAPQFRL